MKRNETEWGFRLWNGTSMDKNKGDNDKRWNQIGEQYQAARATRKREKEEEKKLYLCCKIESYWKFCGLNLISNWLLFPGFWCLFFSHPSCICAQQWEWQGTREILSLPWKSKILLLNMTSGKTEHIWCAAPVPVLSAQQHFMCFRIWFLASFRLLLCQIVENSCCSLGEMFAIDPTKTKN